MGFFSPDQPKTPHKSPESPKEAPKPPGFFGPGGSLTHSELIGKLRSVSPEIPGSSKCMTQEERVKIAEKFGYGKYGPDASPDDVRGVIQELKEEKNKAKTYEEKEGINRTIRWMEKQLLGGL